MGVGRYLKDQNPEIRLISVQPDSPFHGLEGMKHLESALVPSIYDAALADENRSLSTEAAHAMVLRLAREYGLRVGVSAGANIAAAVALAERLAEDLAERREPATIVTILCDNADKYLSDRFWDEL
jgi:cysteine synthase B